jgi:hypothetical protein
MSGQMVLRGVSCVTPPDHVRNLSELLSTCNALAIHGNSPGGLNGLGWSGRRDNARDQLPPVLDIRRASVSGRLRPVRTLCGPANRSRHASRDLASLLAVEYGQRRLALRLH